MQDALVQAVAAVNNNTIVVVNTVGPIIVEAWIDHPNVTGEFQHAIRVCTQCSFFYRSGADSLDRKLGIRSSLFCMVHTTQGAYVQGP